MVKYKLLSKNLNKTHYSRKGQRGLNSLDSSDHKLGLCIHCLEFLTKGEKLRSSQFMIVVVFEFSFLKKHVSLQPPTPWRMLVGTHTPLSQRYSSKINHHMVQTDPMFLLPTYSFLIFSTLINNQLIALHILIILDYGFLAQVYLPSTIISNQKPLLHNHCIIIAH